jgi:hypothetical protein
MRSSWTGRPLELSRPGRRAVEEPYAQLQALARDITFRWANLHPIYATELGISGEDGRLDSPSPAGDARDLSLIRGWEARLAAIPVAGQPQRVSDGALTTDVQPFSSINLTRGPT